MSNGASTLTLEEYLQILINKGSTFIKIALKIDL
jgi:hypothetical protein